ncbi:hypothetical protein VNO77_27965 [Canavalia gladiata]|uniref:Uncharacterized protein n=1 Tax=Canavalia gladiata TaxID=3824 RepID=A0AAN9KYV4_CANGL
MERSVVCLLYLFKLHVQSCNFFTCFFSGWNWLRRKMIAAFKSCEVHELLKTGDVNSCDITTYLFRPYLVSCPMFRNLVESEVLRRFYSRKRRSRFIYEILVNSVSAS